jgi:subtilisin family serine protease
MPTNFQGPGGASSKVEASALSNNLARGTMDPDDFSSGFGVWSGTSFAAPIFASEVAAFLAEHDGLFDVSNAAMQTRAAEALEATLAKGRLPGQTPSVPAEEGEE